MSVRHLLSLEKVHHRCLLLYSLIRADLTPRLGLRLSHQELRLLVHYPLKSTLSLLIIAFRRSKAWSPYRLERYYVPREVWTTFMGQQPRIIVLNRLSGIDRASKEGTEL